MQAEQALSGSLVGAWLTFYDRATSGREPNWEAFAKASAEAARQEIEDAQRLAIVLLFLLFADGLDLGNRKPEDYAQELAQGTKLPRRPDILGQELARTSRDRWQSLPRRPSPEELKQFADVNFTGTRADMVAATEITGATSAGEKIAQDAVKMLGLKLEAIWKTEPGACPLCVPLNGKPEGEWRRVFPLGPPVHVNCRCSLVYRPKRGRR